MSKLEFDFGAGKNRRLVAVVWEDTCLHQGADAHPLDVMAASKTVHTLSVGLLLASTKKRVVISHTIQEDEDTRVAMVFPTKNVKDMRLLPHYDGQAEKFVKHKGRWILEDV